MNVRENRVLFFRWLAAKHPKLYAPVAAEVNAAPSMADLGWIDTLISAIAQVGGAVMAKKVADKNARVASAQAQSDAAARADALKVELLNVNLQRAQAGLPPVDEYGHVIQSAQVPGLPTNAQAYAAAQGPNWVLIGGVAAVGLVALVMLRR